MWNFIKRLFCRHSHTSFTPEFVAMFMMATPNDVRVENRVHNITNRILKNKARYINVSKEFNMPWQVIGVIHYLEGDLDFTTILHNGEHLPITKTRLVPKGRGPFHTWEEAARDAIKIERARPDKWTIRTTLDWIEKYNGLGYRMRGLNSPYLWAGTKYYKKGKYGSDGRYKKYLVSKQIGAVLLLKALGFGK